MLIFPLKKEWYEKIKSGKKKGYRSRYREMEMLVQKYANER